MEKGALPTEKAFEPDEPARQPMEDATTPRLDKQPSRKLLTFAEDTDSAEKPSSQKSSNYKDVLSQPMAGLSHKRRLVWLQQRRGKGLWAQCDDCNRWRFLSDVLDSYELPKKWYCRMNPDRANADCSIPEAPIRLRDEEDLIHSEYSAGSVVWARIAGWPWWPAMVDDCPDTEQYYWLDGFSDIPTHYNVVFFDSKDVSRAWVSPENLKPYIIENEKCIITSKDKKYKNRLQTALTQADKASKLSLDDRLKKYSFIARYKGNINTPKKLNKNDLKKHQKYLKRKYNIQIDMDSSASDDDNDDPRPHIKDKNTIVLGTPKKTKNTKSYISRDKNYKDKRKQTPAKPVLENNTEKTEIETTDLTLVTEIFKQPNSLAVQKGSTVNSTMDIESFDNDTSKTYVPENSTEQSTQCTENSTVSSEIPVNHVRTASPSSDDFDF